LATTSASAEFAVPAEAPATATMRSGLMPTRTRVPLAAWPPAAHDDPCADVDGEAAVGRLGDLPGQEVHVPDEVGHERRQRPVVDRARLVESARSRRWT
jgi:hypothetical protein